ncbi:MAG: acyl-CoA dehydrogenase family protein [Dehalococcoidia bacterium]|nr:acyl-CoA dehydrogenase family protein [Dehalococcoidia bacterium]
MDFSLSEEHKMLQTTVRDFASEKLAPVADELDRKQEFARDNFRMMAEMGLLGLGIPEEYGGSGGDELSVAIVVEELSKACAATADILDAHLCLCAAPIYRFGTDEQKQKFLPALVKGEKVGAMAVTESEAGSDVSKVQMTATRDGDDYILNGTKIFITNGDVCDVVLLFANVTELGERGMTAFLVETDTPGYSKGKKYDKLGMRAATNADQVLEDCRVPAANRLGDEGKGMRIFLELIDHGRIGIAAQATGITRAILERAVEYAKNRKQFGAPIASYQAIGWRLADMHTELEAARLLTCQAAWLTDNGQPFRTQAAMAKLYATELAMRAATLGIQVFGGYGYMMDSPMQRYFRDAKLTEIYEGTSEVQRMVISASLFR